MSTMILLFSLLTPNLGDVTTEIVTSETVEPNYGAIERLLDQYGADYERELVRQTARELF